MKKTIKKIFFAVSIGQVAISCSKESNNGGTTESLFMSFQTPDWQRVINCDLLVFNPNPINDSTSLAYSTSASTNQTFYFTYPMDSSNMVRAGNLARYAIVNYGENNRPFQFSQKLPMDANSLTDLTKRLASLEGFNASSYTEIQAIKYVSSDSQFATFIITGTYMMQAQQVASNPLVVKPVSGTFSLKLKTTRN